MGPMDPGGAVAMGTRVLQEELNMPARSHLPKSDIGRGAGLATQSVAAVRSHAERGNEG